MVNWISTKDALPKDKRHVLVVVENNANLIFTACFDHQRGWQLLTSGGCDRHPGIVNILYWTEFNLPQ